MKPDTFVPRVAQNQRTYRRDKRREGPGQARGSRCANAVLNDEIVGEIRAMQRLSMKRSEIHAVLADMGIHVGLRTLDGILQFRSWRHVK